jgi:hypothetical protein
MQIKKEEDKMEGKNTELKKVQKMKGRSETERN